MVQNRPVPADNGVKSEQGDVGKPVRGGTSDKECRQRRVMYWLERAKTELNHRRHR